VILLSFSVTYLKSSLQRQNATVHAHLLQNFLALTVIEESFEPREAYRPYRGLYQQKEKEKDYFAPSQFMCQGVLLRASMRPRVISTHSLRHSL